MRLIKAGRVQKGWAKELECTGFGYDDGGCGAILLVEERDLHGTRHIGSDKSWAVFKCCACGVCTDIEISRRFLSYLTLLQGAKSEKQREKNKKKATKEKAAKKKSGV